MNQHMYLAGRAKPAPPAKVRRQRIDGELCTPKEVERIQVFVDRCARHGVAREDCLRYAMMRAKGGYHDGYGGPDFIGRREPGAYAEDWKRWVVDASPKFRKARIENRRQWAKDLFYHYGPTRWPGDWGAFSGEGWWR